MGDDTWMSVFPDSFDANMTFPFDSFNVEDLHSVDEGVTKHLLPLLADPEKPFDFLVGHFLGVDHVGHRVGPDHPSMKSKLEQMNEVLTRVVELLDDETLLLVLGDHGMDRTGDHGGDGVHETSAGLWIYSKGIPLAHPTSEAPSGLLRYTLFPGESVAHRWIQQVDIVPTLSLLLGLPIPFNSLGSVIPELFWRTEQGTPFPDALKANAAQVRRYLDVYRNSASGSELEDSWETLSSAWSATELKHLNEEAELITLANYVRTALVSCRSMWAQFNPLRMAFGLALLGTSLVATWALYSGLAQAAENWQTWLNAQLIRCLQGAGGGGLVGIVAYLGLQSQVEGISVADCVLFGAALSSSLILLFNAKPSISLSPSAGILILHTVSFLSNSFTFWEERIVLYLAVSALTVFIRTGITAPTSRLRYRIIGFSILFAVCARFMSMSTVCREEQQPYCSVTFFASSNIPVPPPIVLFIAVPAALAVPYAFISFLKISMSHQGMAQIFFPVVLTPTLLGGAAYWLMEWADTAGLVGETATPILRLARTWTARATFGTVLILGGTLWWLMPLCLHFDVQEVAPGKRQLKVLGFANAFGSAYLLFWAIFFGVIYATVQLTGQVVLAFAAIAMVAFLEVVDSVRDVKDMEAVMASANPSKLMDQTQEQVSGVSFDDVVPLALLGLLAFYATGHEATISSIQWKSAFMLTPSVTYPFSPATVAINSFGPLFLVGLAAPLLALWNRQPEATNIKDSDKVVLDSRVQMESTRAGLGIMLYYTTLLFGTTVSAAILRRHLMVWKVFAPRFMLGVASVLVVDLAVLIGVGIGVARIGNRVNHVLKGAAGSIPSTK